MTCKFCGTPKTPKTRPCGKIEDKVAMARRDFCNQSCASYYQQQCKRDGVKPTLGKSSLKRIRTEEIEQNVPFPQMARQLWKKGIQL